MTLDRSLMMDAEARLLKTSLPAEVFLNAFGRHPLRTLGAVLRSRGRRADLLAALVPICDLRADLLPVDPKAMEQIGKTARAGRPVVLTSASHPTVLSELMAARGLEGVAVVRRPLSMPSRDKPTTGGPRPSPTAPQSEIAEPVESPGRTPSAGWRLRDLVRAMRPHQWVKNILLFLPVVAAHRFDAAALLPVLWGIVAFSAAASSIYIVNDLLDLDADRQHPKKCTRPFAAGRVPIGVGVATSLGLATLALGLALSINGGFAALIVVYVALSVAYSFKLKRMRWVDIATLAGLYTLRVVAGALAAQVMVTGYLLVFIYPVFITLGSVKRLTELTLATSDARLPGRGYGRGDRGDLLNVAGLGTAIALLAFFLYSFTAHALSLYPTQWLMWLTLLPIAGWLIRMVWLGYAGKQDYDPIVFAMRDRYGLSLLCVTLTIMFYAAGLIV